MKKACSLITSAALLSIGISVASPVPRAEAVTCYLALKFTHVVIGGSQMFRASDECDGVYANTAERQADGIRGRFYKDGEWQTSSYGWVRITTNPDGIDKIVGNTIDGREIKGQARNVAQQVSYVY